MSLIGVYLLYRIIFKKVYADSFLKLMCILSIVISANQFYSYNKLETVFPWLVNVNRNWLIVGLTALLISILCYNRAKCDDTYTCAFTIFF